MSTINVTYEEHVMERLDVIHILAPNGGYCVYYSQVFFTTSAVLKIGEYSQIFPVLAGEYSVT